MSGGIGAGMTITAHREDSRAAFLKDASGLLGQSGLTTDTDLIEPWLTDWRGRYTGKAFALASPASTEEVAQLVSLCAEHGIAIVPQGGNSGMVGGATPDLTGDALLLSLRRMNRLSIDAAAKTALCEAGVILQNLHEAAEAEDLRFPLSLGGKGSATVGGLVSTNAGGTQVLRHGVMRALVTGVEAVMADGRVFDGLSPLKKDNRGFDLKQMLIGSEGTLGIVTRISLKLVPAIAERKVVWVGLQDLEQARALLVQCENALGENLEGFEVLPQKCLDAVVDYLPDARPPLADRYPWHALLEFVAGASSANALGEEVEACLAHAMEAGLFEDAAIAANETQAEQFWQLREMIAPAEKARGPAVQHDISVVPAEMPGMLATLEKAVAERFADHEVLGFGHLGDGNIHLHVLAPKDAAKDWDRTVAKQVSELVYERVTEVRGSISAEHGIGQDKIGTLSRTHDPVALDMMRAVKQALDPQGILNPGKLVPLASPASTS